MEEENILIQMGLYTKAIGKTINNTEKEKKFGLMERGMKEIILMGKNTEKANFIGRMDRIMKENLRLIIYMDLVLIFLEIKGLIKELGKIIKLKEKEFSRGLMEGNMMENIKMIKKMDLELFIGVMEKSIKDIGKMGNNMVKEKFIILKKIFGKKEFGKMEKELKNYK